MKSTLSNPTVTLQHSGTRLEFHHTQPSLLEALERHNVPVDFQCRSGYCGACRTRLLKGKVAYRLTPLACLQQGEILPCCCTPVQDIELAL